MENKKLFYIDDGIGNWAVAFSKAGAAEIIAIDNNGFRTVSEWMEELDLTGEDIQELPPNKVITFRDEDGKDKTKTVIEWCDELEVGAYFSTETY